MRVDGVRQQELNIVNPPYPDPFLVDPGSTMEAYVGNKYVLGDLKMERILRYQRGARSDAVAEGSHQRDVRDRAVFNQLRGVNVNAPVNGVRPDPAFANIIVVTSDASMHTIDVVPDFSVNFAGGIRNANTAKWNPQRTVVRFNYRYRRAENNTDGAFSVSPTGSLDDQWSYASSDIPHRMRGSVSTQALRNLNAQISWEANSGAPYTITTGIDGNGDSIFNDRPLQTPRNSARLPWRATLSGNVSYTIPIGAPPGGEGGRRRRRAARRRAARRRWPSEGHHAQPVGAKPDQSRQLLGLQRRDDVDVFPAAHERVEPAPGRPVGAL